MLLFTPVWALRMKELAQIKKWDVVGFVVGFIAFALFLFSGKGGGAACWGSPGCGSGSTWAPCRARETQQDR